MLTMLGILTILGRLAVHWPADVGLLTHLPPRTATLELKSKETNAHSSEVLSVAFSHDGKTLVSGSEDKTLKVWDSGM